MTSPFRHHPSLRDIVIDPDTSPWRTATSASIIAKLADAGLTVDRFHSDDTREDIRRAAMAAHGGGDLWVFGYGSLMWDPAFHFTDVRKAHVPDHARRFILCDRKGGRGTAAAPGLMAALDVTGPDGPGCKGLAFCIDTRLVERETHILFQREMIAPGYHPRFVTAHIDAGPITVLTFVADHDSDLIDATLTRQDQVEFIATGAGILGTSYDYIKTLVAQLATLDVLDDDLIALLAEVDAQRAGQRPSRSRA